jgi:uracil-DNA glycosylase family protein
MMFVLCPRDREREAEPEDGKETGHWPWDCAGEAFMKSNADTTGSAADFIPANPTLPKLRAAAKGCRGCDLWRVGTQTVFGEGPTSARVLMVGEQPGDAEDRAGRPFVGPAGRLLDRALDAAGIDRQDVYVTNAVKHIKWARDARSSRRLHKTPNAAEIRACFPWLEQEMKVIQPRVIVCLGATAAKVLLGRTFSVTKNRGIPVESPWAPTVVATVHPSSVLRAPPDERKRAENAFIADIRKVARLLARHDASPAVSTRRTLSGWLTPDHPSDTSNARTRSSRK